MSARDIAQKYFDFSNSRDLDSIRDFFTESSTYSSDNTGIFFGKEAIMQMIISFFQKFPKLYWDVKAVRELSSNIIEFEFSLQMTDESGKEFEKLGVERIVVGNNKIQHIEVRNL